MTQRVLQSNFLAGQLAKTFRMRRDDKRYYQGAELIKNGIPLPTGGVTRRPPFKSCADLEITDTTLLNGRWGLIPWESSENRSFILALTNDFAATRFDVFRRDNTTGETSLVHSFTTSPLNITDQTGKFSYAQSRDTMYLTSPEFFSGYTFPVVKLTNDGTNTGWTATTVQEIDGPFENLNLNVNFQMDANNQSGTGIEIKAQLKAGGNKFYFTSVDIGKLIRIRHNFDPEGKAANYWGCAIITGLKAGTNTGPGGTSFYHTVIANVQTFSGDNELSFGTATGSIDPAATVNWRLGSINADKGYPSKVAFYQNRKYYSLRNRIMGSRANDFDRFSPTLPDEANNHSVTPDCAIDVRLLDLRAEKINWMYGDQVFHIGTDTARYIATGNTPSDFAIVKQSNIGVADIHPVMLDDLIYARYDKQALLTADFNFRRDRFEDKSLNLNNDQILQPKVRRLATTNYPFNIVWAVLENGTLASLTYDQGQEINAWAIHEIDGYLIHDIAALKLSDEKEVLYAVVRHVGSSSAISFHLAELNLENVEYLQTSDYPVDKLLDLYVNLSSTASISGELHLSNRNIMAIKDGVNYPQTGNVNGSGNFTLAAAISGNFHIGIPVDFRIETLPVAIPQTGDTGVSQRKDIRSVDLGLYRTGSCKVQIKDSEYSEAIEFRKASDDVDKVPPFRDELYNVPLDGDTDRELSLIITQETQAPITILGLNYNVELEGMN